MALLALWVRLALLALLAVTAVLVAHLRSALTCWPTAAGADAAARSLVLPVLAVAVAAQVLLASPARQPSALVVARTTRFQSLR